MANVQGVIIDPPFNHTIRKCVNARQATTPPPNGKYENLTDSPRESIFTKFVYGEIRITFGLSTNIDLDDN